MPASIRASAAAFVLIVAALLAAGPAAAEKVFVRDGVGVSGYDSVAYFTDGAPTPGSDQFTAEHAGVTYKFATAEHRDLFAAEPGKYLPQYGGHCAYAAAKGAVASTDPEAFTVLDGKLYLNFSQDIRQRWQPRATEFIKTADANWPKIGAE
ncbi:MAG: YHS domain-containing (seleno)protein [Dongiaceae bacterium]